MNTEAIINLSKRCTLNYFRDKQNIFFSLMSALIVVMLYLLFLRDMFIQSYPDLDGVNNLVDVWVLSGILGIIPVTTCAGALQTMVEDRTEGKIRDILVTPMKPSEIALGYILSTFIVGFVMSIITFAVCLAYLAATGCPLDGMGVVCTFVMLIPSAISATVIMYVCTTFMKSNGAFSGFFTTVSVLIGFLAGIYMPMGSMPAAMQTIGTLMPASQMTAAFRDLLASDALDKAFGGMAATDLADFRTDMGFDLHLGGVELSMAMMIGYVAIVTVVFFALAAYRSGRRRDRNLF